MSEEGVAWPCYVDFLSTFVFVLMLFLASTVYIVSGAIDQTLKQKRMTAISDEMKRHGILNAIEGTRIRITLIDKVTFPLNKSTLGETGKRNLREYGALAADPQFKRVVVEGHADKIEVKGDEFGNWKLSVERALAVLQFLYLCDDCGFDKNQLRSKLVLRGEGDLGAKELRADERLVGRAGDRRVDIVLDTE